MNAIQMKSQLVISDKKKALLVLFIIVYLPGFLNGFFNGYLVYKSIALFWAADVMFSVLQIFCLWVLFVKYRIAPSDYGLSKPIYNFKPLHFMVITILISVILVFISIYLTMAIDRWVPKTIAFFQWHDIVPRGIWHYPTLVYLCLTAAVFEEVIFKGMLLELFRKDEFTKKTGIAFVATSSFLFLISHWENGLSAIVYSFVFGVITASVYLKLRKNLWPLIIGHLIVDLYWLS